MQKQVKVTRKYQVTIPENVRTDLDVKIGDILVVRSENNRIIMEPAQHVSNPPDKLWCLFGEPKEVDAVKLVEESWSDTQPTATKKTPAKKS